MWFGTASIPYRKTRYSSASNSMPVPGTYGKFGTTAMPAQNTLVSSVRLQYRCLTLRSSSVLPPKLPRVSVYPAEHTLANSIDRYVHCNFAHHPPWYFNCKTGPTISPGSPLSSCRDASHSAALLDAHHSFAPINAHCWALRRNHIILQSVTYHSPYIFSMSAHCFGLCLTTKNIIWVGCVTKKNWCRAILEFFCRVNVSLRLFVMCKHQSVELTADVFVSILQNIMNSGLSSPALSF